MKLSSISPRDVLALVAGAIPPPCRDHIVVVGSLAAGYHLLGDRADALVQTKDVDCLLIPRVAAVPTGRRVAQQLLRAGWRPRLEGTHAHPGNETTPDDALPAIRLHPPQSGAWFVELLAAHEPGDESDKRWTRLTLPRGHFGLPSYRYLDVAIHEAPLTEPGLKCARPDLLALSNLLRNPEIRPERMTALVEGRGIRRSNKDLGRVVAIARLSPDDAPGAWAEAWAEALRVCHPRAWRALAGRVGNGLRALLGSGDDLEEARLTCNVGLLASTPVTAEQFRRLTQRLLADTIEPLEERALDTTSGAGSWRGHR